MTAKSTIKNIFSVLLLASMAFAQQWSGILATSRAVDWSATNPGVVGGIPSAAWTQSGSTIAAYSGTAATINTALVGCGTNHFVLLGAGTFTLSTGILLQPNCVIRGTGSNSTFLVMTGHDPCTGTPAASFCFEDAAAQGGNALYYGSPSVAPGASNSCTWSAGFSANTTSITLTSCGSTLTTGMYINLDMANDSPATASSITSGLLICDVKNATDGCSLEAGSPGRTVSGIDRNQIQIVKITAISGTTASYTVTISPGLYGTNWAATKNSQNSGAWWTNTAAQNMNNAGVENLSLDNTSNGGAVGIAFVNAQNCWVKGVRSIKSTLNHVFLWNSAHVTVQDSYFFGTINSLSQSYGVESFISADNLIFNNIFHSVTAPVIMGPSQGSVVAYNFSINDFYTGVGTGPYPWMQQNLAIGHDAGVLYNLFEGNQGSGFWADVFHGTGGLNTVFRNRLTGFENQKTEETVPVQMFSYNRFENIIGNVLGVPSIHTTYQTATGVGVAGSVYDLNAGNSESPNLVLADSYVATSLMRWGNWDPVNAANRFVNGEVPSGLSDGYANSVPASHTLPASLYLTSKPTWWGTEDWPAIGPDVSGGVSGYCSAGTYANSPCSSNAQCTGGSCTVVASGQADTIPAMQCYLNTMGGPPDGGGSFAGTLLAFDSNTCYTAVAPTNPPAPARGMFADFDQKSFDQKSRQHLTLTNSVLVHLGLTGLKN